MNARARHIRTHARVHSSATRYICFSALALHVRKSIALVSVPFRKQIFKRWTDLFLAMCVNVLCEAALENGIVRQTAKFFD